MDAIILANALVYVSPSSDKSSIRSKQQMWERFLKTLDWNNKMKDKKKSKMINPIGTLQRIGVPVIGNLPKKKEELNK